MAPSDTCTRTLCFAIWSDQCIQQDIDGQCLSRVGITRAEEVLSQVIDVEFDETGSSLELVV